ncbi:hypothetical protein [Halapricum desulfuricans]|uniref:Uncharacterized protein n=1 Tax=Halapricum desulfuricans TaxID=2841257 RepID=A0A897NM57_9EURY|nr:hypothetical protein [Halapricum desulfuricans]QSG13778.1 hypothetical protein HSEST_0226 [Halapricum desulfuricans]
MAASLSADGRDFVLGIGAGVVGFLLGLVLVVVAATDGTELLGQGLTVVALATVALAFGVVGLYDNVALGMPKRGVAHLVSGTAVVLALLAPRGSPSLAFVAGAAVALLVSGTYQLALVTGAFESDEQPGEESDS